MDDLAQLRRRLDDLQARIDRVVDPSLGGSPAYVGQVYNGGAIPNHVPAVFLTHPVRMGGTRGEGVTVSTSVDASRSQPVVVLGPRIPHAGDLIVADWISGRWVCGPGAGAPQVPP